MDFYGTKAWSYEEDNVPMELRFLRIAENTAKLSTCLAKKYGAVLVKDGRVIGAGWNDVPKGRVSCCKTGHCYRLQNNIPRGTRYETCRSIHSEVNAINAANSREEVKGSTLYLYGHDMTTNDIVANGDICSMCRRAIIDAGISEVIIADRDTGAIVHPNFEYRAKIIRVQDWVTNDDSATGFCGCSYHENINIK